VVGTDLSESSDEAVRQASVWASRIEAPLIIAHVTTESARAQIDEQKVKAAIAERIGGTRVDGSTPRVVLEVGSAPSGLIELADRLGAGVLVVGASGAGGVTRSLFGSTADQVVRHAHCAVLVTRSSPASGAVIAATDFSDESAPAVEAAAEQARRRGAPIVLFHSLYETPSPLSVLGPLVVSFPEHSAEENEGRRYAATEMLRTLLDREKLAGDCVVTEQAPASEVVALAQARGAGLVVVGTRGRTGLSRVALGSVSARVVERAPCSVLVVRLATT
jgi:nucleotide-binding universal stress UspA family protein